MADDDDDTVPTTIAPPNTAHGLGTATARREAQEETPIVNTHRQESSVVKAEETSPGEADAAEDGRKNGRKVRKKTADTGEEAGEEAHGQQEANIVVNTWEMADTVVDTDNNNTADLLADADTAEEGPKNGGTGHKKDAGEEAQAHGQQEAKSAVDDNTADVDADTAEDGRKGRKRRKKTADAGKEAPGEEAEAHGQKEKDLVEDKARKGGKKGAADADAPPATTALHLLHILTKLAPTFPPNVQKQADAFRKEVAALIGQDVE